MNNIMLYGQVWKDWLKRKYIDFVWKGGRLQTPMAMQMRVFNAYGYLPKPIIALELFGMHGLWHTVDYSPECSYLEFYEINPIYARFAKKFITNAVVIETDSINAVLNKELKKNKYNFILLDNPMASPYGNNYFEHFDLFPEIIDYMEDEGVMQLNFVYNPLALSEQHMKKREMFYGNSNPSIKEAADVYAKFFMQKGKTVVDFICLPRNDRMAYLALIVRGGEA